MTSAPLEGPAATGFRDATVLVTGACGTVGRALFSALLDAGAREVIGLDNNESELFFMAEAYRGEPRARLFLGDVRDRDTLRDRMRGVDIVLHAAALKHVMLCEMSPPDAVETNIRGVQNVIDAAYACGVERVLLTSSDKAVNPTSVMGTSKLMGERLMTAANARARDGGPIFASTRFGNVLGSRGSVVPIFRRQIARGGPVTLTDPRMTRFIMTLDEAVRLVLESTFLARGGEAFVTKMPAIRIEDLAHVMIEALAPAYGFDPARIEVETIGTKPGEKLYEELLSSEEVRRSVELERYFVVLPAFASAIRPITTDYPGLVRDSVDRPYVSADEPVLSRTALRAYLERGGLLDPNPTEAT